jgi:hypothetical protein
VYVKIVGQLRDWQVRTARVLFGLPSDQRRAGEQSGLVSRNLFSAVPHTEMLYVSCLQRQKYFNVFDMRVIKDANEITHHLLEAIYAHCYNTKGGPVNKVRGLLMPSLRKRIHASRTLNTLEC